MSQGIALDSFLKEQQYLKDYVRTSIHHHHPKKEKFSVDLFKQHTVNDGFLRTPWHHSVLFDTVKQQFIVDHKSSHMEKFADDSVLCTVMHKDKEWFLIRIALDAEKKRVLETHDIRVSMIKDGCGLIVENATGRADLKSDIFAPSSITGMIKHFGVVVLRGFARFRTEEELYNAYYKHGRNGIVPWKSSPVHVVKPSEDVPGYVNKKEAVPIHWDMMLPPAYMGISQTEHKYEDFTCREFLLYCHRSSDVGTPGATTFIDAIAVVLALNGQIAEKLKNITVVCESRLLQTNEKAGVADDDKKEKTLYFGGKGNTMEYPLVQLCSWMNKEVLRWLEIWKEEDHPGTVQVQGYQIKQNNNTNDDEGQERATVDDLEKEIRKTALDDRFFFSHTYEEGDQVYVNNYSMLHGRNSFTNERELWRVQLIPPTDNVPEYWKSLGHTYYPHGHGY